MEEFCGRVVKDMEELRRKSTPANGPNDPVPKGSSIIAMKIGYFGGRWDYHFMAKHSGDSFWSFQTGQGGVAVKIEGGLNPEQVYWSSYDNIGIAPEINLLVKTEDAYTSDTKYLIISP